MPIGSDVVGPTVLSGTTEVLLGGANWKVPADAKCILAVIPVLASTGLRTTAEAIAAKLKISSNDAKIQPYEVLAAPIGSNLEGGTGKGTGISPQGKSPRYPVNCPVSGGDEISFYGVGLFDHTVEPYMMVVVIYADYTVGPQYHAKVGTLTATNADTTEKAGTAYSITHGERIKKAMGFAFGTTVAEAKGIMGKIRLSSSDFAVPWDIKYHVEPAHSVNDTDATTSCITEAIAGVAEVDIDIPIKTPCTIQDYFTLGASVTTAGKFITGVLYN